MSKLLTVFGATGNQGGAVIRTVLRHPQLSKQFRIRAITRDPSRPSGQALAAQGVDVVKADLGDKASLTAALEGSHSVFAVTNFWETASKETEVAQGHNIADVAKALGVQHLIWSSLPNVSKVSGGKLTNVEHFDGKAEIDEYIREIDVPMTTFQAGFYMSNLHMDSVMRKSANGSYDIVLPVPITTKFPLFAAQADTGKFVASILLNREALLGGKVLGASGWWSPQDIIDTFHSVMGKTVRYREAEAEEWKSFLPNEKIAQEMLENYYLIRDYKYYGGDAEEDLAKSIALLDEAPLGLKEYIENQEW